jgi:hypothetical protein
VAGASQGFSDPQALRSGMGHYGMRERSCAFASLRSQSGGIYHERRSPRCRRTRGLLSAVRPPCLRRRAAIWSTGVGTSAGRRAGNGEARWRQNLIGKQAVVIGAGMARLAAGGALADSFDQ